jgi:hypothetical protein
LYWLGPADGGALGEYALYFADAIVSCAGAADVGATPHPATPRATKVKISAVIGVMPASPID